MLISNRSTILNLTLFIFLFLSCSSDSDNNEIINQENESEELTEGDSDDNVDEEDETEQSSEDENKVYPTGIVFETQNELSAFLEEGYTEINGNLSLLGPGIEDITNCTQLKKIKGPLYILGTSLENLDGFNNLDFIGNTGQEILSIENNPELQNIEALSSFSQDLIILEIDNNPKLRLLKGLNNISKVNETLDIRQNDKLQNLDALQGIQGEIKYIYIISSGISNLIGLSKIEKVKELIITSNPNLTSISFGNLQEADLFTIQENKSLLEVIDQPNFTKAEGLIIGSNPLLENING